MKLRRNITQVLSLVCILLFCNYAVYAHAQKPAAGGNVDQECAFESKSHLQSGPALHPVLYTVDARTSVAKISVNKLSTATAASFSGPGFKNVSSTTCSLFPKAYISHIHPTHTFW